VFSVRVRICCARLVGFDTGIGRGIFLAKRR
jgi:hypothetical protein